MKIFIIDNNKYIPSKKGSEIKKLAKDVISQLTLPNNTELCITFIDDTEMRKLNSNYRNIDRTTDVLSFPQDEQFLGDVVISIPTALRNAKRYVSEDGDEVKRLIIHGILHLLGYDHKKKKERETMRAKEKELFSNTLKLEIQF